MKSTEISTLLQRHADVEGNGELDVVFVLFAEPRESADRRWSTSDRCIDWLVRNLQPSPALAHCEILLPAREAETHVQFATYIGKTASWQVDRDDNKSFYLGSGQSWRALPVFGRDAAARVRGEAELEVGTEYSLLRYATAARPFRWLSSFVSNARRAPAHCATMTARILRNALRAETPCAQLPSWYGPTSLFCELGRTAQRYGRAFGALGRAPMASEEAAAVSTLLRAPLTTEMVETLGDERCEAAVRALTLKVCAALDGDDDVGARIAQKQLATALLRWTLYRTLRV